MALTKRDRRGLLISFCIIAAVAYIFPLLAMGNPSEHNYKAQQDDWHYTYRHREGTWHTEIGKQLGDFELTYRYADLGSTRENRIKLTHDFFEYKDFSISHRIEYRSFDNKEDHWRVRAIFEYTPHLYGPVSLYVKLQPRLAFNDDKLFFYHRDQLGLTWKQDNWKLTPFIERYALDGFEYRRTVYGTHFEIKL